ncbi:type II toxin-antitoxin system PemK/MazF family toxin [Mesorhizobium sp. WSM4313]|uniref:type II toxin-antitoxin system PemK/MazF family toxin n=1 Tax=Mesorhizobium sp. WSM4313 TaxID=2029412 RepID=UPI001AECF491
MGGFCEPEMVKRRPAIVISPRLPHRDGLCSVVPISLTAPTHNVHYVVKLDFLEPLPAPFDSVVGWVKCDMVATVSFNRLDLFRTGRDHEGKRKYLTIKVSDEDFERVKHGILCGLGFR